jgi:hypothetical protein
MKTYGIRGAQIINHDKMEEKVDTVKHLSFGSVTSIYPSDVERADIAFRKVIWRSREYKGRRPEHADCEPTQQGFLPLSRVALVDVAESDQRLRRSGKHGRSCLPRRLDAIAPRDHTGGTACPTPA